MEVSDMLARRGLLGMALFGAAAAASRAEAQGIAQVGAQGRAQAAPPAASPAGARPMALGGLGLDASQLGLRPGAAEDQSRRLQEALVEAARRDAPLLLPPGRYRVANVTLPENARLIGVPGVSVLVPAGAAPLLNARRIRRAAVTGLTLDGMGARLPDRAGLLNAEEIGEFAAEQIEVRNVIGNGLTLTRAGGSVIHGRFSAIRDTAIFSLDSRGLIVGGNVIEDIGNNGVQIWRSQRGDDGSQVRGNRISRIRRDGGGDGPNGNGVVIFRADGVIAEGNTLRDCALTFIRNNAGSNVQILGNNGARCGEVGYYSEFAFEGAILSNNIAEDVAHGFNITNLDHGGRIAVCSNNIIRRVRRGLAPWGKDIIGGIGIRVEAEAAVTGNVVEECSDIAIALGWSWAMRNLLAANNVIRDAGIGVGVSLVPKERNVVVSNNVISGARIGAVVGTEYDKPVTGDLTRGGDRRSAGVRVEGNAVA
jgi:uncharacterized secreted repeat protein (TIGR03808 family)